MHEHDREKFVLAIEALASAFRVDATEALLEGYWMALDDLSIESVVLSVRSAMRQCKHMPRAVELRELTGEMPLSARAVHAWAVLQRAIGTHGAYRSVDFDDPVINATVRNIGGWQRLCSMNTEEFEKWARKDFERVYVQLCASGVTDEQVQPLIGMHEQNNAAAGHAIAAPTVVATGLPPHREGVLRQIEAAKSYELTAGGARIVEMVGALVEKKSA